MPSQPKWFQTARRWGRVTIRENEAGLLRVKDWADFWSRCRLDGVTLNAGGYIATYPTRLPLHYYPASFGKADPFGDLAKAAKDAGLKVVARFDPSRTVPETYYGRPDWFFLGADGQPRRTEDRYGSYYTCVNTQYYWDQTVHLFNEVMDRYDVDGFLGENWEGYGWLGEKEPCHCAACVERYRLQRSADLPRTMDWSDPNYRLWLDWRRECLRDVWNHWDDTLKLFKKGIAFIGASTLDTMADWADLPAAPTPEPGAPLWRSGAQGRLLQAVSGGDKRRLQTVSATEGASLISRSDAELQIRLAGAVASGSIPCVHIPSAAPEDARAMKAVEPFYRWHAEHETYLAGGESAASVAVIVSERTQRHYSRSGDPFSDHAQGFIAALIRAGILFDLLHDSQILRKNLQRYRTLVLPNVACLDSEQCDVLWEFGSDGGGLVATFETSVYDETGAFRGDFGMTDRLGVKLMRPAPTGPLGPESYFRLNAAHEALNGVFPQTALIAGGGRYLSVELLQDHKVPLTVVPPAPSEPTEAAWTFAAGTVAPAMALGPSGKGRVVYFPTEPDLLYWLHRHEDHARLLEAAVRWANREPLPVELSDARFVDVRAYRQEETLVVPIVNVNGAGAWEGRCDSIAPLPPQTLAVRTGGPYRRADLLVSGAAVPVEWSEGQGTIKLPQINAFEVVVLKP